MQLRVQTTKSLKGIAWQKVRRKRGGAGGAVHELYIYPTIRGACLIYEQKNPHSLARIVLCLLWNAIAVHLIVNDSEVSRRHP